jgi:HK97 family phage portal protein
MSLWTRIFGGGASPASQPRAAVQQAGGGITITSSAEFEEALRTGSVTASGVSVTPDKAMRVAAVYACVRVRCGIVANMPLHIKRRVNDRTREDATDHPVWTLLRRKPNRWQTPAQLKRMMQAHLILRGNAYAMIVRSLSKDGPAELIPLHPDRVACKQNDDLSLSYVYARKNGGTVALKQSEVFHLVGLTLDGVHGVSAITYARETIGLSLAQENHGATVFKNGARVSNVLTHPEKLGPEGLEFLRASLDAYRSGGESEGKALILEEGMTVSPLAMTAEDAQWIESRKFSRTDIAMFLGVPPHMIGDTEKNTSWGTGIESQTQGFITFSAEDDLTIWEETINRDLIGDDTYVYARFNRAALVRGDIKARWEAYVKALQWGVFSPDEVRALEDMNPREDGQGGQFYDPPNTAGGEKPEKEVGNEPPQTA